MDNNTDNFECLPNFELGNFLADIDSFRKADDELIAQVETAEKTHNDELVKENPRFLLLTDEDL